MPITVNIDVKNGRIPGALKPHLSACNMVNINFLHGRSCGMNPNKELIMPGVKANARYNAIIFQMVRYQHLGATSFGHSNRSIPVGFCIGISFNFGLENASVVPSIYSFSRSGACTPHSHFPVEMSFILFLI
jgi:hypothetical protein